MYTCCIDGRDPGELSNSLKWPKPPPSMQAPAKDKSKRWEKGASYGRMSGKTQQTRVRLLIQIQLQAFSIDESFQSFSHPPFPGTERETSLQIEVSPINVNVSYKRVTSALFSELLLCLLVLKNNRLQDNSYAKEAYFGLAHSAPLLSQSLICRELTYQGRWSCN